MPQHVSYLRGNWREHELRASKLPRKPVPTGLAVETLPQMYVEIHCVNENCISVSFTFRSQIHYSHYYKRIAAIFSLLFFAALFFLHYGGR